MTRVYLILIGFILGSLVYVAPRTEAQQKEKTLEQRLTDIENRLSCIEVKLLKAKILDDPIKPGWPRDASECPDCGGSGIGGDPWKKNNNPKAKCDYCGGKGWVKWS